MTVSQNAIPTLSALARAAILAKTRSPRAVLDAVTRGDSPPPETDQAITDDALRVRGLQPWIPPDARAGAVLILRGPPLKRPGVAIVGARASDPYGLAVAAASAHDVVKAKRIVISGGAEGCDATAHRAALDAGGLTWVVLGGGHDRLYPAHHRTLFREISERGGTIASPFWPETPPAKFRFLARNRVIAALSEIIVVARARRDSGALSTGFAGLDMGRAVLAVPGSVGEALSEGAHHLLSCGARPMLGLSTLMRELNEVSGATWPHHERGAGSPWPEIAPGLNDDTELPEESAVVLDALRGPEISDLEALQSRTKLTLPVLLATLLELELMGLVTRSTCGGVRLQ
jgi:DNA processing protein